jgi:hypothetical protein
VLYPYRGLAAFREEDAAFYAGRSVFARQLLGFTLETRTPAVEQVKKPAVAGADVGS